MKWTLPQASDLAPRVDAVLFTLVGVTGLVALAIFSLIVVFCWRYRRGSGADRSNAPAGNRRLELAWTFVPLAIFLGFFGWAAAVYADFYREDVQAMRVFVVGKQWMWRVQHANGRREIDALHLPAGRPVKLVLATEDVIHSFWLPAFRVKQDAVPGRYTTLVFTPTREGTYDLRCTEYCGTDHARMGGAVTVLSPEAFARWLDEGAPAGSMAARGFEAYRRLGCSGCHEPGSTVHAPPLRGLLGRTVHLADGRTLVADEAYVRDSILLPKRDVVAGHAPVMPSFAGQVDEGGILDLIAWMRATKEGTP